MNVLKLFTSSLTSLLTNDFTHIPHTLALVGLRLTQPTDLGGYLADQLLVDAFQSDLRILPFVLLSSQLQFLWDLEDDVVRVTKRKVQQITLAGSLETHPDQLELTLVAIGNTLDHVGYQ